PEGQLAGGAGGGGDVNLVVGDFVDAPGGSAKGEDFADAGFENHFFIELADADGLFVIAGEEDAIEAAVGDGAGIENGEAFGAFARSEEIGFTVPGDARTELGKLV